MCIYIYIYMIYTYIHHCMCVYNHIQNYDQKYVPQVHGSTRVKTTNSYRFSIATPLSLQLRTGEVISSHVDFLSHLLENGMVA